MLQTDYQQLVDAGRACLASVLDLVLPLKLDRMRDQQIDENKLGCCSAQCYVAGPWLELRLQSIKSTISLNQGHFSHREGNGQALYQHRALL